MQKKYLGRIPKHSAGWIEVLNLEDEDFSKWIVFKKTTDEKSEWVNLKMVCDGKVKGKANYWMSINSTTKKFAVRTDNFVLAEKRPKLFLELTNFLNDNF